jgi:hypothetical protein
MSQRCHFQTHAPQLQLHSITSTAQCNERRRHSEAEHLGSLRLMISSTLVDLLDRQFGWLVALENTSGGDTVARRS